MLHDSRPGEQAFRPAETVKKHAGFSPRGTLRPGQQGVPQRLEAVLSNTSSMQG